MVARYYGRTIPMEYLRNKSQFGKEGVSLLGLSEASESIGLKSVGAKLSFDQLIDDVPLPAILYWDQYHFVVLTPQSTKNKLIIADPDKGIIKLSQAEFLRRWLSTMESGISKGVALLIEPTPDFASLQYDDDNITTEKKRIGWSSLLTYAKDSRVNIFFILLCLVIGTLLQLIFPYLTKNIVDKGINARNLGYIQLVLAAQLMLLFSQTVIEFIRSRILMQLSTRINLSILSSFWAKLLRLPMAFFNSKHPGDIIQRIGDHRRIESFLTGTALNTLFSFMSLLVFSVVLLSYNLLIFIVFALGSVLYLLWIRLFLRLRRKLDYERFEIAARENNATMQLVNGIQEIKLNNAEHSYRWAWEGLQATLFKLNFRSLSLTQYQQMGAFFINQGKNVAITFIAAKLVIDHQLTLGMMLAAQYIIGQLNGPVEQLINFVQQAQDARISIERLNDIHVLEDEEPLKKEYVRELQEVNSINIKDLSFSYPGAGNEPVLKNINLLIPQGKTTAIVGMSGSGKTTLIKLLLRFYENYSGDIYLDRVNFRSISPKFWRSMSGAVMQDSFIFNDNIQKNITVTEDQVDEHKLQNACKIACLTSYIEKLPLGFNTKLGAEGSGISGGQKQRIAIARAVYKDPKFIFFDEATNSLDANNEKMILENLQHFLAGKTAIVVAHRLSTVKNADKIVVLDKGEIVEEGTHTELVERKGNYYQLVKNQLELGS
jgi:ATP-binding cassette subfamily B protein